VTGPLATTRSGATATLLKSGGVMVIGGLVAEGKDALATELWDPATGKFTLAAPIAAVRQGHEAAVLSDGKVLIVGGLGADGKALATAELYQP
jgi:hypothetical protein